MAREDGEPQAPDELFPQPVAAPPILALYGFFASILMIGPWLAGLYGNARTPLYIAPLVLTLGGIAQFTAAVWAFKARQWVPSSISGAWAMVHLAWGLTFVLVASGTLPGPPDVYVAQGLWYIILGIFTWVGAAVAWQQNWAFFLTLLLSAIGATAVSVGALARVTWLRVPAGWLLIFSATGAWYTASAMLLNAVYGRWPLPTGPKPRVRRAPKVAPGRGEPGVQRSAGD